MKPLYYFGARRGREKQREIIIKKKKNSYIVGKKWEKFKK
jgi:hypothetical protein